MKYTFTVTALASATVLTSGNGIASEPKVVALVLQDTSDVELPCEASSVAPL